MIHYLAVLAVMLACFTGEMLAVTDQEFQDLIDLVRSQGFEIRKQSTEISELKDENRRLWDENKRQDAVINELRAELLTHGTRFNPETGLAQNTTIEERVSLLEVQVAEIDEDVTGLDEDVNFLFDEQVIQDERLFTLETGADELNEEVEDLQDATLALDFRVTVLEETGGSGGNSSISELEVRVETLEGTAADHEARITSSEGNIEDLQGSSADHETRLTTAEENIQGLEITDINHESRISSLEENAGAETIAFYAVLTSYDTIADGAAVEFNEIVLNQGNGYDNTTGVFTVPLGGDGVYYFSTYLLVQDGEFAYFDIELNDDIICTAEGDHTSSGSNDSSQAMCSAIVGVIEGDEVKVVMRGAADDTPVYKGTTYHYNGFNGFRI